MKNTRDTHQRPSRLKRAGISLAVFVLLFLAGILVWFLREYRGEDTWKSLVIPPAEWTEQADFSPLPDSLNAVPGFSLAAQNDSVALYVNLKTAETAVYDRRSSVTVYSNPREADSDPVARAGNLENLKSQFILTYLDANAREGTPWSSYAKAVANGQVSFCSLPDGVRVIYNLSGEKLFLVPDLLTPEWYEVLACAGRKQAAKSYEFHEDTGLYSLKTQGVTARNRQQIDQDARGAGFTLEDYEQMQALRPEDAAGEETEDALSFTVTLDWRLTADGVQVTLPYEGLAESGSGKIRAIQLLPFFGAAGSDETGTLVLPEGSGALLRFNNGKTGSAQYSKNIYDLDLADSDLTATQNARTVRLALFGICREQSSVLASCERGASLASVTADTAGRNNSFNFAYFTFNLRRTDILSVAGEDVIVAEKDLYPVDCAVRYTLLGADRAGYNGLAAACRERMIAEGKLREAAFPETGDIPFYFDVIGGIKETAHWLGIQYLRVLPMTTFAQAEEISAELASEGIANQQMNFQGWMNGGYYHDPVNRVSVLGSLGGEKGLRSLSAALEKNGGALYPDVALQFVSDIARGFVPSEEASRYYAEGYVVDLGLIGPVSLRRTGTLGYAELGYKLLSPRFLPRYARRLANAVNRLDLPNLGLRDLGLEVHADKRRTGVISREADLDLVRSAFETLSAGRGLLVTGGNDYCLPYVRHVLNAPMSCTAYPILDEEIPLWQLIVHGSAGYAGTALNMAQSADSRLDLLRLVEYGASVHFTFTARDAADMKYTGLNRLYSTTFSVWKEKAAEAYRFVNGALRHVSGAAMVSFDRLSDTLSRTVYSNGVTIYVNTGSAAAAAGGYTVEPMNYLVTGGEKQ